MQDAGEAGNLIESVGAAPLAAFALWTALVQSVDVQPVGQNRTETSPLSLRQRGSKSYQAWSAGMHGPPVIGD